MADHLTRSERKEIVRSLVGPYIRAKKDQTMIGQYKRLRPAADGRIRTAQSASMTETSRLNSSDYFIEPRSSNLQNVSKTVGKEDELYRVRDIFVSDPGFSFLAVDFSGAEALLQAAYSGDWTLYQKLIEGEDVHTWTASLVYGKPESEVGKGTVARQVCKNVRYAGQYMASVYTITRTINKMSHLIGRKFTQEEIGEAHAGLLKIHPWEAWWESVGAQLDKEPVLWNCFGFRRQFLNPDPERRLKEALAFLPQSTVAQKINRALIAVWLERQKDGEIELLLQIHDELLLQVRDDLIDQAARQVIDIMERTFELGGREIYIPADAQVGKRWEVRRKTDPEEPAGRMVGWEEAD